MFCIILCEVLRLDQSFYAARRREETEQFLHNIGVNVLNIKKEIIHVLLLIHIQTSVQVLV